MKSATATELKKQTGAIMDMAAREPVAITKQGRNYAVILSWEDFERLKTLEDNYWGDLASRIELDAEYAGPAESLEFLKGSAHGS